MRDSVSNWEISPSSEEDYDWKQEEYKRSAGEPKARKREEEQKNRYTTRFKLCYSFLICDNSQILEQT